MKKNNIYLILQGRIGNQLFQYALARAIQKDNPNIENIIIDDSRVKQLNWENSLMNYDLPNVIYTHKNIIGIKCIFTRQFWLRVLYKIKVRHKNYLQKYEIEKSLNNTLCKHGMFICENGYMGFELNNTKPVFLEGFFQSEKYFAHIKDDLVDLFSNHCLLNCDEYPVFDKLKNNNVICISVKVEHNIGSSLYDVCSVEYWRKAIEYITKKVENPLFFVCSDNVDYVLEHLIDLKKYKYIVQDKKMPVCISLLAMSKCKHFIIGNTTYAWWAQYLAKNNDKIVIAPSRWMNAEMPIDIYQDNWIKIDV